MTRNEFIWKNLLASAGLALPFEACDLGSKQPKFSSVHHILPTVNHEQALIAISFHDKLKANPILKIGHRSFEGIKTDTQGQHFRFDLQGLEANTAYELALQYKGDKIYENWELKTFPHPKQETDTLKLLVYTCAGGHPLSRDLMPLLNESREQFVARRSKMLKKALSLEPDAIIAIGDQIYWDLGEIVPGIPGEGDNPLAFAEAGKFNEAWSILGSPNETVLKKAINPQISDLYGDSCRSVPIFMLNDDHDYFANDVADKTRITFPPSDFRLRLARTAQAMYWPEFLPNEQRPIDLPGSSAKDRITNASETFGTLRYGNLAEILMYDCRRFVDLNGDKAGFIPPSVEKWLNDRTRSNETAHTIHIPSLPIGWSAGKWMEWYPDKLNADGILSTEVEKYAWQQGWQNQHDRILKSLHGQKNKTPFVLNGDLHTLASGKIYRSGNLDFESNPINSLVVGSLGSTAFPSAARGIKAANPTAIGMQEDFENIEESGFSIVEISPDDITVNMYKYLSSRDPLSKIDELVPFKRLTTKRRTT